MYYKAHNLLTSRLVLKLKTKITSSYV